MKRIIVIAGVIFLSVLGFGGFGVFNSMRADAEKRRRAEINMLDLIRAGVLESANRTGQLPKTWEAISNSWNWEYAARMSEDGFIPPATQSYTLLEHPVPFTNVLTSGSVFLVRSKPGSWPGLHFGRWVLVGATDRVSRVWIPENKLMPNIRSPVTAKKTQ